MFNNLLKELRQLTGAGIMDIKSALVEAGGDKAKAVEILRKKGALKLGKKADRAAKEGLIEAYVHPGAKLGVLLELNCETDFVARTQDFKNLAKELALHIAAANPLYISPQEVPAEVIEKEKEIYRASIPAAQKKSQAVVNKIIDGKLAKYFEEICLLEQPYVKRPEIKIKDLLAEAVGKIGENVRVRRFIRFVLGN